MFTLKDLAPDAVPAALEKAIRYRLINEPEMAGNICQDVLRADPANQEALRTLILAMTDQFHRPQPAPPHLARTLVTQLQSDYERSYYAGIIEERLGIAWMRSEKPRAGSTAFAFLQRAMGHYERAEAQRPHGNDDAILRWNSCARLIDANPDLVPHREDPDATTILGD